MCWDENSGGGTGLVGEEGYLCASTSTWGKNPSCVTERGREEGRKRNRRTRERERSE